MSKRRSLGKRPHPTGKSRDAEVESGSLKGHEADPLRGSLAAAQPAHKHVPSPAAIRETIESVVVAFVLAFLFRTFEAEAFVIPTGSMAPTLMGRHKDLECPVCGYQYQVSASDEVDPNTNASLGPGAQVVGWTCPMCRWTTDLRAKVLAQLAEEGRKPTGRQIEERLAEELKAYPSFKGDRILVGKFCYQFSEPERWDVAVFKYPGGAKTNFIKRLVGLPNEVVEIHHGDIFTCKVPEQYRNLAASQFRLLQSELNKLPKTIARKDRPEKLLAMLQPVYDNDYVLPETIQRGWPARWQPWPSADGSSAGAWTTSKDCRSFRADGRAAGETWLRYQHIVPRQWPPPDDGTLMPAGVGQRQLISDFCAYNTGRAANKPDPDPDAAGLHWVGDLAVQGTLEVLSDSGQAVFELVEGGWRMQCRIDVATGEATLSIDHEDPSRYTARTLDGRDYRLSAQTAVRGPGKYEIMFSNCDDQLRLWVQGCLVLFGGDDAATCYAPLDNRRPQDSSFASDFSPVGIGSQGADLRLSHLKVLRDIYYIAETNGHTSSNPALTDFQRIESPYRVLSDPARWDVFDNMQVVDFPLQADQFFALGDNSPKSKDSRLWEQEHYVRRELLIGKALYIYWPHSWNKLPGTNIPFPLFPNFSRMGFVR